ncbi:MAG: AsmA family protein [Alphaproteobacteria bacterium]|nr:AsmA family protein [Alphaproteobacteria bacterium]
MIKKIILISLGVIVLIIGGLAVYVSNMDWNAHKESIAAEISSMIGEKVEFSGDLNVSLLPHPRMLAKEITIINPTTSQKLETEVSLRSVLKKTPDIKSLTLNNVEVWISADKDGKTNWHQEGEPQFINDAYQSQLQNFILKNSIIHIINPKYNINADFASPSMDIKTESLAGPYTINGSFTKDNELFGISLSVSSLSQLDDVSLNFIIMHQRTSSFLRYDGSYNFKSDNFSGDFSGNSENPATFANILLNQEIFTDKYNKPLLFSVAATSAEKYFNLSHFVVKLDDFIEGAGDINIPYEGTDGNKPVIDIKYQFVTLDVQPLMIFLRSKMQEYQKETKYQPSTDYDAVIDITSEHLTYSKEPTGFAEHVSAKGTWKDNVLSVDEFYAACQGDIILTMSGSLSEENSLPYYYAKVSMEGENFLNLINSVDSSFKSPLQSSYRNGKISFDLYGDAKTATLGNMYLSMDKVNAVAAIGVALDKKSYEISFKTDKINLDNYLLNSTDAMGIKEILSTDSSRLSWLADTDLKLQFEANEATFRTVQIEKAVLNAEFNNGVLKLQKAQGENIADARVSLSGTINGIGTPNISFENTEYELSGKSIKHFLKKLEIPFPNLPLFAQSTVSSKGTFSSDLTKTQIDTKNIVDDVHFNYKGSIETKDAQTSFNGDVDIKGTNFEHLMDLIDVPNSRTSLKNTFNGTFKISGNEKDLTLSDAELQIGASKYIGTMQIKYGSDKKYGIQAQINTNELALENLIYTQNVKIQRKDDLFDDNFIARPTISRDMIDYDAYRKVNFDIVLNADQAVYKNQKLQALSTHITNEHSVLKLNDLHFVKNGSDSKADIEINYSQDPVAKGSLYVSIINISGVGGKIYGVENGFIQIKTDFETPAISLENAINGISGTISFNAGPITIKGLNFAAISDDLATRTHSQGVFQMVRDNLQSGTEIFTLLTGNADMQNGTVTLKDVKMNNDDVELNLGGKISIGDWKMNVDIGAKYLKITDIPEFSFSLTGMINKPVLDINVENIVKKYDSHWEKVEKEEKAKKDEEQRSLQEQMQNAQKKTFTAEDKVSEALLVIDQYSQKTTSQTTLVRYQGKTDRLNLISQKIDSMQSLARLNDYTANDIQQIETSCLEITSEVEEILNDAYNIYISDMNSRFQTIKDTADQLNSDNEKLYNDYQKMLQNDFDELLKIDASQHLVNNTNLKLQQGEIANYNSKLIDMYDAVINKTQEVETLITSEDKEVALIELKERVTEMKNAYNDMKRVSEKSEKMLLDIINEQRRFYESQQAVRAQKKAQEQKELKENKDNLLISDVPAKSSDNSTSSSENTDNRPSDAVSQQDNNGETKPLTKEPLLKVISGGDSVEKVSGTISKSYDESTAPVAKSSSGLLKPIDGEVQKVGGTITVK